MQHPFYDVIGYESAKLCLRQYVAGDFAAFKSCAFAAAAILPPGRVAKVAKIIGTLRVANDARIARLTADAAKLYPKLAGKSHLHHVTPKYLGGAANGERVKLDAAYHQLITNEFRRLAPYRQPRPSPARLKKIKNQVYSKYPFQDRSGRSMREAVEFRIPEESARRVLRPEDGTTLGGTVRKIELSSTDPRFSLIRDAESEYRQRGITYLHILECDTPLQCPWTRKR